MTRPGRAKVLAHILNETDTDAAPRLIDVVSSEAAVLVLTLSRDEADEFAEEHHDYFVDELVKEIDEADLEARPTRIALNTSSPDLLQGSTFVEGKSDPRAQAKRRRRMQDATMKFLRKMAWEDFEACCKGILAVLGCPKATVTRSGNDQGVDFFGVLPLKGRLANESFLPSLDSNLNVWMVGQAKHYQKTKVSTPDLRELVGSVQLARAKASADGGVALRDLNIRICDPIFYLFFTTGTISADGKKLLKESGMVAMDGGQVAAYLSDNSIGHVNGVFDASAAQAWIDGHR